MLTCTNYNYILSLYKTTTPTLPHHNHTKPQHLITNTSQYLTITSHRHAHTSFKPPPTHCSSTLKTLSHPPAVVTTTSLHHLLPFTCATTVSLVHFSPSCCHSHLHFQPLAPPSHTFALSTIHHQHNFRYTPHLPHSSYSLTHTIEHILHTETPVDTH